MSMVQALVCPLPSAGCGPESRVQGLVLEVLVLDLVLIQSLVLEIGQIHLLRSHEVNGHQAVT